MNTRWAAYRMDDHGNPALLETGFPDQISAEQYIVDFLAKHTGHKQTYSVIEYVSGITIAELLKQLGSGR